MSKDRLTPCIWYVCFGSCEKGRNADYSGYCQRCDKYKPRAKLKHRNIKKEKLEKLIEKERF